MAEEIKTTPAPEGQTLEPPAPEVSEAPPAPEPGAQGVIPGMEGPPAPENKVINLSSVRAGQEQTDPAKEGGQEWEKPQEQPEPPRRGRRPKNKEAPAQGERPKRKGRPPKAEKQTPGGGGAGKMAKTATQGNYADDEDPLSLKSDFILSLCELIVGGRGGLAPVEKTVIDRCVRTIYRPYLADPAPERMPILQDLYDELLKQSEPEARRVASALELYCTGSLNLFNHRTNVQVNSRLLCFDIKALGKMLKKIGLLILTDQIWGRVTENRDRRRATWVYQDEFHVLLAEPQTAAYSVEIFRRFRKWGAIPSGITQNVKSLLESSEIESIFGNCDFLYMLSQAAGDQKVLASHLGISPHQLSYVTHSGSGEGLLFYGDTTIPFVDHFPQDTELYTLLTTKPEDKANG